MNRNFVGGNVCSTCTFLLAIPVRFLLDVRYHPLLLSLPRYAS